MSIVFDLTTDETSGNLIGTAAQFQPELAADFGLNESIVLADFWWRIKIQSGVQDAGGGQGVYYSSREIERIFPYWTREQFNSAVYSLVDQHIMDFATREPDGILIWLDDRAEWSPQNIAATSVPRTIPASPTTDARSPRFGYVYILKSQDGYYKIGKSVTPEVRIKSLGVVLPFAIEPIHLIKAADYSSAEIMLHKKYAEQRVRGEWFALDRCDLDFILSIKEL